MTGMDTTPDHGPRVIAEGGGITVTANHRDADVVLDHTDEDGDQLRVRDIGGAFLFGVHPRLAWGGSVTVPTTKLVALRDALTEEIERARGGDDQ